MQLTKAVRAQRSSPLLWSLVLVALAVAIATTAILLMRDGGEEIPGRAATPTLSTSDETVRAGDVITLRVEAAGKIWGVATAFEELRAERWKPLYYWSTYRGKGSIVAEPYRLRKNMGFPMIGFTGDDYFSLRIPNVDAGDYRISKRFSANKGEAIAAVHITVVP